MFQIVVLKKHIKSILFNIRLFGIDNTVIDKLSDTQQSILTLNKLLIKFQILLSKDCTKTFDSYGTSTELATEEDKQKLMEELTKEYENVKESLILSDESYKYFLSTLSYLYSYINPEMALVYSSSLQSNYTSDINENTENELCEIGTKKLKKTDVYYYIYI